MTPNAKPLPLPALASWMFARGLVLRDAGEALGLSGETVRRYCLPFGDPRRRVPPTEVLSRIFEWTAGAVTPADFYPEHLRSEPPPALAVVNGGRP